MKVNAKKRVILSDCETFFNAEIRKKDVSQGNVSLSGGGFRAAFFYFVYYLIIIMVASNTPLFSAPVMESLAPFSISREAAAEPEVFKNVVLLL